MSKTQNNGLIRLVIGLGNPGAEYAYSRHNMGFLWVDALAKQQGLSFSFQRNVCGQSARRASLILLKPHTYMNASGESVARALAMYKDVTPTEMLVIHDEIDLDVGQVRLKYAGGTGGHNGLSSIVAHTHTHHFWRLRIGVGRPVHKHTIKDYVLSRPSHNEQQGLQEVIDRSVAVFDQIKNGQFSRAQQYLHTALPPPPV